MALQSGRRPSLLQGLVSAFKSLQLPKYGIDVERRPSLFPLYSCRVVLLSRVRCVHGARALPATPAPRFQDDTTSSRSVQATPVVRVRDSDSVILKGTSVVKFLNSFSWWVYLD